MIVTDQFVFIHLPRCGGTFISHVIRKFFPSAREIGHHMPRRLMPKEYSRLPVLGTARSPWELYVSLYHYALSKEVAANFVSWMSEHGKLGIQDSIRNLADFAADNERLDALIATLPDDIDYSKRYIPNVSKDAVRAVRGTGVGYYTFRFNEMFGTGEEVFFCRVETLRQDLVAFFERIGALTEQIRDYVLCLDDQNRSQHLHYSTYYTPELAQLVATRDRRLIERFGYTFQDSMSAQTALTT